MRRLPSSATARLSRPLRRRRPSPPRPTAATLPDRAKPAGGHGASATASNANIRKIKNRPAKPGGFRLFDGPRTTSGVEPGGKPSIDGPRIGLEDRAPAGRVERGRLLDIAFGVVEGMSGFRIDPLHRTDHLRGEQNILG